MGIRQFPRTLRTLRNIHARQWVAQMLHVLAPVSSPVKPLQPTPEFSRGGPVIPFLPCPEHVGWGAEGRLELIGEPVDFASGVDWLHEESGPLWAYHLHNCDHLRDSGLSPGTRTELMLDWIRSHRSGVGWDAHPTSLRILSWGKLLLFPEKLNLDEAAEHEVRASLAQQVETLSGRLEVRLQGNHLLSNLVSLVFAGLLFEGSRADRWLAHDKDLTSEIAAQFHSDGGHEERSPMYHGLLLESLLDLLNLAQARPERSPKALLPALKETAERALVAMDVWRHPDGEIALFSDSALGVSHHPDALIEYASALGVAPAAPLRPGLLEQTGYARLQASGLTVVASVSGPAPPHQIGHAHCDALSFELSCHGERVVTDTGVYEYVPGERRRISRETLSHSTLEIEGAEQAEIWAAHRMGGRPRVELVNFEAQARIEATCSSWSTPDRVHRRVFMVQDGGLEIRDRVEGSPADVRLSLPLAPGIRARTVHGPDGSAEAHLELPSGKRMRVMLPIAAEWRMETCLYFPRFGVEIERNRMLGEARSFESGTWRFELLN